MANNNKLTVDLPFFELCNQAPTATSATSAMCSSEEGNNRYIYYLTASTFYRYDTIADTWQQLANPNTAPVTALSMRYTMNRGFHGRVISATSTTVTIPGLRGPTLDGKTIRILSGTGAGQDRTLTYTGETILDDGIISAVFGTNLGITDSTKRWRVNQWSGYIVGITFGTDATQYKKILYNDSTTLYVSDANLQPHDPWNCQSYLATTPYALPVAANSQYQIMSSTYSVSSWTTTPDYTSYFTTLTGGIYLLSSAAGAPFFTLQYYDVIHDSWVTKTVPQSLILAALGTDFTTERLSRVGTAYTSNVGIVTSTSRTLQDSTQALTNDRYANHRILITGGTGAGQNRRIVGHTTNTYTVNRSWDTSPDNTSTYQIWNDYDKLFLGGGAAAALFAYSPEFDYWMQGQDFDSGICANISVKMNGWVPLGVTSGTIIAAGVRAVNPVPTAGGTGYAVGDYLTCSVGGTGAQVRVTSIAPGGVVTGIELVNSGTATGFTTGTGKATTATTGTGVNCTIEITSVGETATITTASAHWFKTGDSVTFAGTSSSSWNTSYTVLGVPYSAATAPTTFCVISNVGSNMTASNSQSTTVIVDASKNWVTNEHVGRLVQLNVAGTAPTTQTRWITANTATTLTVATITAGVNGTSKYAIYDSKVFGVDDQRKQLNQKSYGYATSGSTTTLVDSSKNWIPNQWAGYLFKIETGTGYGSGRISIVSNTETTLTFATQTFTPDTTSKYEIADTWGLMTAGALNSVTETTTKNWIASQWIGKRIRITGGTNLGQEASITANTATNITATLTAPDTTSSYAILAIPARGAGIELVNNFGASDNQKRGRYFYFPRGGGSNTFDIFDIPTGRWLFGYFVSPQAELFTTGSSYAYDGGNKIYFSRSTTGSVIRVFAYDINRNTLDGAMTSTIAQSTAHIGNLMEIVYDPTKQYGYVYCLQNTGTLLTRALILDTTITTTNASLSATLSAGL
mgnify:FL=1